MPSRHANYWSSLTFPQNDSILKALSFGLIWQQAADAYKRLTGSCMGSPNRNPKILSLQGVGVNHMRTWDFVVLSEEDEVSASAYPSRITTTRDLLSHPASIPPTLAAWACQTLKITAQSACLLCFLNFKAKEMHPCKQACAVENSFSWNMSIENRSCFILHLKVTCYNWPRRSETLWECLAQNFLHAQVLSDPEDHRLRRVCVDVPVHVGNMSSKFVVYWLITSVTSGTLVMSILF